MDGFIWFQTGFSSGTIKSAEENMSSALSNPSIVDQLPGRFQMINSMDFILIVLVIPKPVQGERKMIIDLSFPNGNSASMTLFLTQKLQLNP